ncbi:MAG: BlaI/MecI/CopY family transcriptional regulator [Lachnospiraceae bacterium]|nr:BlaI/MecI/CopY family transcriptional regulator [Lachnospiraceae bacterium]
MQIEKLTEGEEMVMKAVWDCKKEPVLSEVVERVNGVYGKNWKPQTVSTFLAKLVRKNYLKMQRDGKIYTYKILIKERVYSKEQLKRLYIFLYNNDKEAVIQDLETL